jgi:predicted AAA+ superfamily ATPase
MRRTLMEQLVTWKSSPHRKPLIMNGARQVGKTWLLKEFGALHFENVAYVSLDNDSLARSYFDSGFDVARIIASLSLELDMDIQPGRTLIVLDEVQACPKAITSLKYFCENAPEYAVAAAGSLLGISATEGTGFPVGKVNMLDLYPLTFTEFLDGTGNERFGKLVKSGDAEMMNAFSSKLTELLKQYCVVGGMPEAVNAYVAAQDVRAARAVQQEILNGYVSDFAKHIPPRLLARTMLAWESIPGHLSQENKKFIFGQVRKGARAADFEESLAWLEQAGLICKVRRVSKPHVPLSGYCSMNAFKVFMVDVGLLGATSGLEPRGIVAGNKVFTEFKGALTEQYVCQQLIAECSLAPYYWSAENSSGEIDFLVQDGSGVFATEVKAEENLRSKSLRAFKDAHPEVKAVRFSLSGYREQEWMRNVPLYAISCRRLWA